MPPSVDATLPVMRRTRKSIASHTDVRKALDKDNATTDVSSTLAASRKKSRSKSLGPGGLDALRSANGNRRASLAIPSKAPRSILKATIPPLADIPPMKPKSKKTDLIDFGEPLPEASTSKPSSVNNGSKIALRTEEEQQAAAREREEKDRRDARRKSLANRRVSFAAEATLHTFHEVEFPQDSTTSTDSTRRNSTMSNNTGRTGHQQQPEDASTLSGDQEDTYQKKQHRGSGVPPVNFHNPEDDTATSTVYSSDSEPADAVEEVADVEDDGSDSDSDDGTMMSIDEVTGTTAASDRSLDSDDGESSTLDEVLRLAARRAGTQRLGEDGSDNDDDDGEEFIPSFGWGQQSKSNAAAQDQENLPPKPQHPQANPSEDDGTGMDMDTDMDMDMDMDMTRAMGGIIKPSNQEQVEPEEEMSMDVTRVFGGIVGQKQPGNQKPTSMDSDEDDDDDDDAPMEEATMEFTTAIGGIRRPAPGIAEESENDDEDMSMEMTTIVGGVLPQKKRQSIAAKRRMLARPEDESEMDDFPMDMTIGVGQILSKDQADSDGGEDEDEEDVGDATMGMDMTTAIGGILNKATNNPRALGKLIMEEEADTPDNPDDALQATATVCQNPSEEQPSKHALDENSTETISPGLSSAQRKSFQPLFEPQPSTSQSPSKTRKTPSPAKTPTSHSALKTKKTPTSIKAKTPTSIKATTPQLNPISATKTDPRHSLRNSRTPSPARQPARASSRTPSPVKSSQKTNVFQNTARADSGTPTAVSTPQRRLSGIGLDRAGLGSPQVAALFDRRGSIGDVASAFVPGRRGVTFQDPKTMAKEVDKDRQNEEDKENRKRILEREADGSLDDRETTLNLREMIDSMSPKRKPLKGRKSLHVGSAKGLLGKRPNELDDEDEEAEENDGVKRLKGHQSSPVKNVRLQQPPSRAETTGKLTLSLRKSLQPNLNASTPTLSSPERPSPSSPSRCQGHFKDIEDDQPSHTVNFELNPVKNAAQLEDEADQERIHLQDFLNMTSIRFMELTTTKRRHTTVQGTLENGLDEGGDENMSLERRVIAGACTVPMLELYQHSCRELKKYISEGRRIVKEIETDTFEDNPPLFKEYMAATSEIKTLMDKQFMNVKNHARLLSKAMWYEWRMKLQDGLKEGLIRIDEGMQVDEENLKEQKKLLDSVLPAAVARYNALLEESGNLEEAAKELADCDPEELEAARNELLSLDQDIAHKRRRIADLREQFQASEVDVEDLSAQKQKCLEDIKEAEKIREECRGWTCTEVNGLKARVDAIERSHGWAVTGISGTTLSMAYKREIEIVFDISPFNTHKPNTTIDLWYIADTRERDPIAQTSEKEFFLECIRDHVRALPQSRTEISGLLEMVRLAWDKATLVSDQVSRINITFPTKTERTSDSSVAITTSLLLVPLETRVEVKLTLVGQSDTQGLSITVKPEARVLYGEHFNVSKIGDFLSTRVGKAVGAGEEEWSDVLVELHGRLIARGRKQA